MPGPKRLFGPGPGPMGLMGLVPAHVMGMGSCQEPRPIIWAWAIGHIIYTTTIYIYIYIHNTYYIYGMVGFGKSWFVRIGP